MPMDQRREAVAAIDVNALPAEDQQALVAAVMAPEPPKPQPDALPHIRARIPLKRGNGFYRPTYGPSENGSRTLCGAPAGLDFTFAEARNLGEKPVCPACKTIRAAAKNGAS
jgi:hypothetical protein